MSESTDPVEAIAEVIYESDWTDSLGSHPSWAQMIPDDREDYRINASAVVAYLIEHPDV